MLSRHIERRAARRPYWQINDQSTDLIGRLYQEDDAAARAVLLRGLADADVELAVLHPVAFGADPNPDEGGRDLAESLAAAGDLCWLVARTEEMVAAAEWTPARDLHTDHNL